MTFIVKQTTQRAGGGEIVRTKTLEADQVVIGRGADCDVQLPDLAVSLRHARMRITAPGVVVVEALSGQPFEADRRFVEEATLYLDRGPELKFGAHALSLTQGAALGDVEIAVSRLEPASSASSIDEEVRALAPGKVGWSKRAAAWLLGLGILSACIGLPVAGFFGHQNRQLHSDQQWAAGPLSKAHGFLANDCQACHRKAFVATEDSACLTCHRADAPVGQRLAAEARSRREGGDPPKFVLQHADHDRLLRATPLPADLGGKVKAIFERTFRHSETRCASCHREHLDGEGKALAVGHAPASVPDKPSMDMVQGCTECHGRLKSRLRDTPLADTTSWHGHPAFRPLVTVSLAGPGPTFARLTAEQPRLEANGLTFSHRLHLAPGGGVARMGQVLGGGRGYGGGLECASCHRPDGSGKVFKPVQMTRDCGACHSLAFAMTGGGLQLLPHGDPRAVVSTLKAFYGAAPARSAPAPAVESRRIPGAHAEALASVARAAPAAAPSPMASASAVRGVFTPGGACYDCHKVIAPGGGDAFGWRIAPVRLGSHYLPRGVFDHGVLQHRQAADGRETCTQCHKATENDRAEVLMLPKIEVCADCHGKARQLTATPAAADCVECHSYHAPSRPERAVIAANRWAPPPMRRAASARPAPAPAGSPGA